MNKQNQRPAWALVKGNYGGSPAGWSALPIDRYTAASVYVFEWPTAQKSHRYDLARLAGEYASKDEALSAKAMALAVWRQPEEAIRELEAIHKPVEEAAKAKRREAEDAARAAYNAETATTRVAILDAQRAQRQQLAEWIAKQPKGSRR